ncbi:MAG: hypothetical protein LBE13_10530 [Bacteroidales bacterium]|nr:hypothetical protein [Bacteroidales bacterium]
MREFDPHSRNFAYPELKSLPSLEVQGSDPNKVEITLTALWVRNDYFFATYGRDKN